MNVPVQQRIIETEATRRMIGDRIDVALAKYPSINTPERMHRFRTGYADRYYAFGKKSADPDYLAGYMQCHKDDDAELRGRAYSYARRPQFAREIAEADPRFRGIDYERGSDEAYLRQMRDMADARDDFRDEV